MKIITYGFNDTDALRWHFGEAEYTNFTGIYTDLLTEPADKVVIAADNVLPDALQYFRLREKKETNSRQNFSSQRQICWKNGVNPSSFP